MQTANRSPVYQKFLQEEHLEGLLWLYKSELGAHAEQRRLLASSRLDRLFAGIRRRSWQWRCESFRCAAATAMEVASERVRTVTTEGLSWVVPEDRRRGTGSRIVEYAVPTKSLSVFAGVLQGRLLGLTGHTMIDVGANVGITAIPRVSLGHFRRVYGIEPDPLNYACLVRNVLANRLAGYVFPDRAALSSVTGRRLLLRDVNSIGGHRLLARAAGSESDANGTLPVDCWTLESWMRHRRVTIPDVHFIKIDTEGEELAVLSGAADLLRLRHIAWQLELWPEAFADICVLARQHFTQFAFLQVPPLAIEWLPVERLADHLAAMGRSTDVVLRHA